MATTKTKEQKPKTKDSVAKNAEFRTPIVAVMGHVDHGKTSLLDALRGTNVTAKEAGGITQNTRAHQIETKSGHRITFIDTPGHEAFGAMRSRGAQVTDFVLLVVAADDGIQAQTKQSIEFAKASNTPIIVAINKVDISGVNTTKIKQQLSSFGVVIEEYGGESMCFEISATKKIGLDDLIEGIELLSQVNELKPHIPKEGTLAEAFVLESNMDKRLGAVALCILKAGELKEKQIVVGKSLSPTKVRSYLDEFQANKDTVAESDPFWVTGLKQTITSGDRIYFMDDEKAAKAFAESLQTEAEEVVESDQKDVQKMFLEMLMQNQAETEGSGPKILNVIVKASSEGTLEAVKSELKKLDKEDTKVHVLEAATGEITEGDVKRAKLASGIVISFQLPVNSRIEKFAKQERVLVRNYEIIYEMMDELGAALEGLIEPEEQEVEVARAKVKQVFTLTDGSIVAGSEVTKGTLLKGYRVYVERPTESTKDEIAEVGRGKIVTLRINKSEVKEVKKGQECGIMIDPKVETIQEGDEVVAYKVE